METVNEEFAREFPPRQKPGSFSLDQVLTSLQPSGGEQAQSVRRNCEAAPVLRQRWAGATQFGNHSYEPHHLY